MALPPHLDPEKIFITTEAPAPVADPEAKPVEAAPAEKPTKEAAPEKPAEKEPADDDEVADDEYEEMSLDELEARIDSRAEEKLAERDKAKPAAEEDDPLEDPKDRRIRELEAQAKEREEKDAKAAEEAKLDKKSHEVASAVGKLKMSKAQLEATLKWFDMNPDMEDHPDWPFERVALRVNPDLRGNTASPDEPAVRGDQPRAARVIGRGATGDVQPTAPTFTPRRGNYSDVTAHAFKSGQAQRWFTPNGRT